MTTKEAIKSIRDLLKATFAEQETEQKFEAGKLADGTVIQYSSLDPGADIYVLGADGAQQPAPAGELELEDGRIIVISEPGKIAEVKAKAEEAAAEENMNEDKPTAPDYAPQISALEQENASLKTRLDALEKKNNTFGQLFRDTLAAIELLGKEDSAKPAQTPKQTVFTVDKDKKEKALDKVRESLQAIK
jgi:hypothetical protein